MNKLSIAAMMSLLGVGALESGTYEVSSVRGSPMPTIEPDFLLRTSGSSPLPSTNQRKRRKRAAWKRSHAMGSRRQRGRCK